MSLRKLTDGQNDVIFSVVTDEDDTRSNEITNKQMEDGSVVSDHINNEPMTWDIKGVMVNRPDSEIAYSQLGRFWKERKLLRYTGRVITDYVQIQNLRTHRDKDIADGFEFTMTLKQVQFTKKQEIKINTKKLNIPDIEALKEKLAEEQRARRTKLKKKTNAGRKGKKKTKQRQLDKILKMY